LVIETSHSTAFKQWLRGSECESLQNLLCNTGKPKVYHVFNDTPISTSHRIYAVVIDKCAMFAKPDKS